MVLQVGKAHGLCLKQEGKFTEVITDQNIQPAIHIEVVHHYAFPGLLWHIMSLQWLSGRKRPVNTFLAPPCVVCLHPALANTDADGHSVGLSWLRDDHGEAFLDTPHEGKTELQF